MANSNSDIDAALKLHLEKKHRKKIIDFNSDVVSRLNTIDQGQNSETMHDYIFQRFLAANYPILDASRKRFVKRMIARLKNSDMPNAVKASSKTIENESNVILDKNIEDYNNIMSMSVASTIVKNAKIIANIADTDAEYVKLFSGYLHNKTSGILINSVQSPAEQSKLIVADHINEQSLQHGGDILNKTWVAVLDDKTRPWHAEADGQRVSLHSLFIVGGEALSRPGDTSHGASLSNIINCRCCAEFNL